MYRASAMVSYVSPIHFASSPSSSQPLPENPEPYASEITSTKPKWNDNTCALNYFPTCPLRNPKYIIRKLLRLDCLKTRGQHHDSTCCTQPTFSPFPYLLQPVIAANDPKYSSEITLA